MIAVSSYTAPYNSNNQRCSTSYSSFLQSTTTNSYNNQQDKVEHDHVRSKLRNKIRDQQIEQIKSVIRYNLCVQQHILSKMSTNSELAVTMGINQLPVIKFKRMLKILSTTAIDEQMLTCLVLSLKLRIKEKYCLMLLNFIFFGCPASGALMVELNLVNQLVLALQSVLSGCDLDVEYVSMAVELIYKIAKSTDKGQLHKIAQLSIDKLIVGLINIPQKHTHIKQKALKILTCLPNSSIDHQILKFRPLSPIIKLQLINFAKTKSPTFQQYHKRQLLQLYSWVFRGENPTSNQIESKMMTYAKQLALEEIIKLTKYPAKKNKNCKPLLKTTQQQTN